MPILCDEDQVYVHCEDTVSAVAGVLMSCHRLTNDNSVLRVQGYKFEALPNGEQLRNLRRFAGSCRFVYNKALALNKQRYENKEKRPRLCGHVRFAAKLEDGAPVAFRCALASIAAILERPGASLHKLLQEASRLSGLPQEGYTRPPTASAKTTRLS